MIVKLRRRVTAVLMLVFLFLIVSVMACTIAINAQQSVERQKEILRSAAIQPLSQRTERTAGTYRAGTPYFSVRITPGGKTSVFARAFDISDAEAISAADEAQRTGLTSGLLPESELRYLIRTDAEGSTRITFISTAEYAGQLRTQIMTCLLLAPILLVLLYFLAALPLSRWLTKPVGQTWEAQKQFIADASHELKTPLTVILANLSILRKQSPEDKWLESTQAEAQRMRQLVEEMLTLARTESEPATEAFQPVSLSDLLNCVLMTMEPLAFDAGVTLNSLVGDNITVQGSEVHLRRLMMILLDNAIKYAGGEKRVTVSLTKKQERVELRVVNTGSPIPAGMLPHLFDRFYRCDANRTSQGFGLGLAIARQIVQLHKGRIQATSRADEGTTFLVVMACRS
ncbi:MAG: sensor histidine kinase [Aristaeellaceae bacterium]